MFALSGNGVLYSTVVGMYLDIRCFQSEVSCEERETADLGNLLQNMCFKTKEKSKIAPENVWSVEHSVSSRWQQMQ